MASPKDGFAWPEQAVQQLRDMWAAGNSAGGIAKILSLDFSATLSRSAVLGKIARLGIHRCDGIKGRRNRSTYRQEGAFGIKTRKPRAPRAPKPAKPALVVVPALPPEDLHLSIFDLTLFTCHAPIGDPKAADFHYCGSATKTGSSYCPFHHARFYTKKLPKAKRKPGARLNWASLAA